MTIDGMHQIGEVAEAVGLSLRSIRHWDEVGVAPPSGHSPGGFRLYTDADIERIRLAKALKPLDLSLEKLRDLLDTRDQLVDPATGPKQRAELAERLAMYSSVAEERCIVLAEQLDAFKDVARSLRAESAAN